MLSAALGSIDTLISNAFTGQDNVPVKAAQLPPDMSYGPDAGGQNTLLDTLIGLGIDYETGGFTGDPSLTDIGSSVGLSSIPDLSGVGGLGPGTSTLPGAATISSPSITDQITGAIGTMGQMITGSGPGVGSLFGLQGKSDVGSDTGVQSSNNGFAMGLSGVASTTDFSWLIYLVLIMLLIISVTALVLPEGTSSTVVNISKLAAV